MATVGVKGLMGRQTWLDTRLAAGLLSEQMQAPLSMATDSFGQTQLVCSDKLTFSYICHKSKQNIYLLLTDT